MSISTMRLTFAAAGLMLAASASGANASYCGDGKTVTFAGIDWESGAFITEVMKTILSKGYDCQVDSIPGNSVTLEQATANNDVQIFAEEWLGRSDVWNKAVEEKKVIAVGKTFVGASEGWFVPDYVVHGDPARNIEAKAPDLKSVSQLTDPKIAEIFADPEEPSKGRFLNCPSGWTCEGVSTAKLEAYKLGETYVNFRPGTGTALDAAITSAYLQGEPILFYYWSPTAILGKFKLIQLEEPAYNEACWKELSSANGKRDEGCAFGGCRRIPENQRRHLEQVGLGRGARQDRSRSQVTVALSGRQSPAPRHQAGRCDRRRKAASPGQEGLGFPPPT